MREDRDWHSESRAMLLLACVSWCQCLKVEIDPWTRYAPLEKEDGDKWKTLMKDLCMQRAWALGSKTGTQPSRQLTT
eukprot:1683939-Amphidinium_carterae.1